MPNTTTGFDDPDTLFERAHARFEVLSDELQAAFLSLTFVVAARLTASFAEVFNQSVVTDESSFWAMPSEQMLVHRQAVTEAMPPAYWWEILSLFFLALCVVALLLEGRRRVTGAE